MASFLVADFEGKKKPERAQTKTADQRNVVALEFRQISYGYFDEEMVEGS
jgi:hypothetical protein